MFSADFVVMTCPKYRDQIALRVGIDYNESSDDEEIGFFNHDLLVVCCRRQQDEYSRSLPVDSGISKTFLARVLEHFLREEAWSIFPFSPTVSEVLDFADRYSLRNVVCDWEVMKRMSFEDRAKTLNARCLLAREISEDREKGSLVAVSTVNQTVDALNVLAFSTRQGAVAVHTEHTFPSTNVEICVVPPLEAVTFYGRSQTEHPTHTPFGYNAKFEALWAAEKRALENASNIDVDED